MSKLTEQIQKLYVDALAEVLKLENLDHVIVFYTKKGEYDDEGGYAEELSNVIIPVDNGYRWDLVSDCYWCAEDPTNRGTRPKAAKDTKVLKFVEDNWWFLTGFIPEDKYITFYADGTWYGE